jgi:hypothetical protein
MRFYTNTSEWQDLARALLRDAQLIVVHVAPHIRVGGVLGGHRLPDEEVMELSPGLRWELETLVAENVLDKVVVLNLGRDGRRLPDDIFGRLSTR